MRGIRILGDYIVEFVVITLIVIVSALSVVLFVPALVGLNGYFSQKKDVRVFKDIFHTMKENIKILIPYTIFQLVIIVFPVLNIYFFNTNPERMNYVLLSISYVVLVIGSIYLTTAPTIIVNMKVTFFQLLYDGLILLFGSPLRSLLSLALVGGVVALIIIFPYAVVGTLYLVPMLVTRLMKENFYILKARALHISVYEVKAQEVKDDYIDEYGKIKHDSVSGGQNEKD